MRADFYKADLSGADLTDGDFRGSRLEEADLDGAVTTGMKTKGGASGRRHHRAVDHNSTLRLGKRRHTFRNGSSLSNACGCGLPDAGIDELLALLLEETLLQNEVHARYRFLTMAFQEILIRPGFALLRGQVFAGPISRRQNSGVEKCLVPRIRCDRATPAAAGPSPCVRP